MQPRPHSPPPNATADADMHIRRPQAGERAAGTRLGHGRLLLSTTRGSGSLEAATYTYEYDLNGNRSRWTNAEDNDAVAGPKSETYTYDGFDRMVQEKDRDGTNATAPTIPVTG